MRPEEWMTMGTLAYVFAFGLVIGVLAMLLLQAARKRRMSQGQGQGTPVPSPGVLAPPTAMDDVALARTTFRLDRLEKTQPQPPDPPTGPILQLGQPEQSLFDPQKWSQPVLCAGGDTCPDPVLRAGDIIWEIPVGDQQVVWCVNCVVNPVLNPYAGKGSE